MEDFVVKVLPRLEVASEDLVLAHEDYVAVVGEVGVEGAWDVAVGEHLLDLMGCGIWWGHFFSVVKMGFSKGLWLSADEWKNGVGVGEGSGKPWETDSFIHLDRSRFPSSIPSFPTIFYYFSQLKLGICSIKH